MNLILNKLNTKQSRELNTNKLLLNNDEDNTQ